MPVTPLILLLIGFLGAAIGSFLTLITYRLPRDESIGLTRSRCPACHTTLRVRDLVPVLSWAASRGRCRHCGVGVSIRYPLIELACAAGAVAGVMGFGLTLEAFSLIGLWWCIVAIFITDFEHQIILDEVQLAAAFFALLHAVAINVPLVDVAVAGITGGMIGLALKYGFLYLRNKDGLGLGDVKFLVVAGMWLASAANFVPFLFFAGVLGILSGVLWRIAGKGEHFPFGPALAVALLVCVLVPHSANDFWQLYGLLQH